MKKIKHYSCQSHGILGMMISNKLGSSLPEKDKTLHLSITWDPGDDDIK